MMSLLVDDERVRRAQTRDLPVGLDKRLEVDGADPLAISSLMVLQALRREEWEGFDHTSVGEELRQELVEVVVERREGKDRLEREQLSGGELEGGIVWRGS